jgi:hypothetical protein
MLPWSGWTYSESVRGNVGFLRQIVGDGSSAATFCRMLPYGDTPIRDRLEEERCLRGDVTHPDYTFPDLRLNDYYRQLHRAAGPRISDQGVCHELTWAGEELGFRPARVALRDEGDPRADA